MRGTAHWLEPPTRWATKNTNSNQITDNNIKYTPYKLPIPIETHEGVGCDNILATKLVKNSKKSMKLKKFSCYFFLSSNMNMQAYFI